MKFIHIADVHLGANPDAGKAYSGKRPQEIWESFRKIIDICEKEHTDILLIAGDLFHRQPLLRELKEVNYEFSRLTHTKVVLIAGNHDYIKPNSYYLTFQWNQNVCPILSESLSYVEFKELNLCVYGLSYHSREIVEPLYDYAEPLKKQKYEILLAHGGDDKHIPVKRSLLQALPYDYIAFGHIHRPGEIEKNRILYAGALEPLDKNDIGPHGYIKGSITDTGTVTEFVPCAKRSYIHETVKVNEQMTAGALKKAVKEAVEQKGIENLYKIILKGHRDPEILFDMIDPDSYGNILEIVDDTHPAYDFVKLLEQNRENLLGRYIQSFLGCEEGSIEYQALYEGVQALLETKRGSI